jgi:transposase
MLRFSRMQNEGQAKRQPLDPQTRERILRIWWTTPCSLRDLAKEFGVSHMTVYRLVRSAPRPV